MDGLKFYRNVIAHENLEWLGAKPNADGVDCAYVAGKKLGNITEVPIGAVKDHDWDQWRAVMLGERTAKIMRHVTRIVGYYSDLQNWNPSKIAELHDRQRGEYGVPDPGIERVVVAA
jgi:hypothetical protein